MNMEELERTYNEWYHSVCYLSVGLFDGVEWNRFLDACKVNIRDTVDFFIDKLSKQSTHAVHALFLLFPGAININGGTIQMVCRLWLMLLEIDKDRLCEKFENDNFIMKKMCDYSRYCTAEQTKLAHKLGAPIGISDVHIQDTMVKLGDTEQYLVIPSTQEMIEWLKDKGVYINVQYGKNNVVYSVIHIHYTENQSDIVSVSDGLSSEKDAIDAALFYLEELFGSRIDEEVNIKIRT